jgi:hypothetical protein
MGSGAMTLRTKFHKDWFRHSKDNGGDTQTHTHTHTEQRDLISLLYFFKIRQKAKNLSGESVNKERGNNLRATGTWHVSRILVMKKLEHKQQARFTISALL